MTEKNPHAVELGRLGGKSRSPAKLAAIAINAKKGGWPKGRPRKQTEATKEKEIWKQNTLEAK